MKLVFTEKKLLSPFLVLLLFLPLMGLSQSSGQSFKQRAIKRLEGLPKRERLKVLEDHISDTGTTNPNLVLPLARWTLNSIEPADSAYQKTILYNAIGNVYEYLPKLDSAILIYDMGLTYAKRMGSFHHQAVTQNNLGNMYIKMGEFEKGQLQLEEALSAAKADSNDLFIASISANLANVYEEKGEFELSLQLLLDALAVYREVGDPFKEAVALSNIGNFYSNQGSFDLAKENYLRAIKIQKIHQYYRDMARVLVNLANLHGKHGQLDSSFTYLQKALEVSNTHSILDQKSRAHYNLGEFYVQKKEFSKAISQFQKTLYLTDKFNIRIGSASSHLSLSSAHLENGNLDSARHHYKLYQKEFSDIVSTDIALDTLRISYGIAKEAGNYRKALLRFQTYHMMNDSLKERLRDSELIALQKDFELEEKRHENELLKKEKDAASAQLRARSVQMWALAGSVAALLIIIWIVSTSRMRQKKVNDELNQQKKATEAQNKRLKLEQTKRERILKTVSHDFKNQIFNIQGVSSLILSENEKLNEEHEKLIKLLKESADQGLNIIEELALERKKVEKTNVNLSDLLIKIVEEYNPRAKHKNINLVLEIEEHCTVLSNRKALHRILSNLLSNALKYSEGDSEVKLKAFQKNNNCTILLSDEGQGFKQEELETLFEPYQEFWSQPTGNETSTGIGLSIVKEIADSIGLEVSVKSKWKEGTTFTLTFKEEASEKAA